MRVKVFRVSLNDERLFNSDTKLCNKTREEEISRDELKMTCLNTRPGRITVASYYTYNVNHLKSIFRTDIPLRTYPPQISNKQRSAII